MKSPYAIPRGLALPVELLACALSFVVDPAPTRWIPDAQEQDSTRRRPGGVPYGLETERKLKLAFCDQAKSYV